VTDSLTFRSDLRRGEIYWLDWSPGRGSEQSGLRPALIIQSDAGNSNPRYNLTIVATLSTKGKSTIPTHVEILPSAGNGLRELSYIKAEQIMTVTKARLQSRIGKITEPEMTRVESALRRSQGL
jgi:mRNA interferase MazF